MNQLRSILVPTASSTGRQKLGQPVPLSNLDSDENSLWPQAAQTKIPDRFSVFSGLENARSVL
jgi:hypothetical protein